MACPPHSPTMPRTPSCTAALIRLVPAATSRTSAPPPSWWKVTLGICSLLVVQSGGRPPLCSRSQRPRPTDIRKAAVSAELLEENLHWREGVAMVDPAARFTLRQLAYFVTVADEGTMAGA